MLSRITAGTLAVLLLLSSIAPAFAQDADIVPPIANEVPIAIDPIPAPIAEPPSAPPASVEPSPLTPSPAPSAGVSPEPPPAVPLAPLDPSVPTAEIAPEEPAGGADTQPTPPYSSVQPVPSNYNVRPEVDQSTGALTYRYPLNLPPGRNGMTPELTLTYNSQDRREGSQFGFGWSISLPVIERQNLRGIRDFFEGNEFSSSLSGEMVATTTGSITRGFNARIDDGSFIQYTFISTSSPKNIWVAETKDGTKYTFGNATSSRLIDLDNDLAGTKVSKWFIETIEDTNGNKITFTYYRNLNQLYPSTISYTDTSGGSGPFLITFVREQRPEADRHVSYANGFRTETQYRISEIQVSVSGQLQNRYALGYTASSINNRSLLTSITQTGYDELNIATALPPTTFSYTAGTIGFVAADPEPFTAVGQLATSSLRHGFLISDINGDAYADLVRTWERDGSTIDRGVWLNDRAGSLKGIPESEWTGTSTQTIICHEAPPFELCNPEGTAIFDRTGDLFPEIYRAQGGSSVMNLNLGTGWGDLEDMGSAYSLLVEGNYRPSLASFDGANPPYVIGIDSANGISYDYGTDSRFGNRVSDVNHDGLPDVVRSTGVPSPTTNGLDEEVYLNTGISSGGVVTFSQNNWLFLNGTNVGANAPAANAIFERDTYKGAFLADMNGDELPDVIKEGSGNNYGVYRHTGNTWVSDTSFSFTSPIKGIEVADMNGDGLLDVVLSDNCGAIACTTHTLLNTSQTSDLLATTTVPTGGTMFARYKASSLYKDAQGNLLNPSLPMAIQTVETLHETDPVMGISATTTYEYAGGTYFFENLINRRFAGFAQATTTKPDGTKIGSYFNVSSDAKIGRVERTDIFDPSGKLLKRTLATSTSKTFSGTNLRNRFITVPQATVTIDFGENGTASSTATHFGYASSTSALVEKTEYGEVTVSDLLTPTFTDTKSDARTTLYTYAVGNGILEPLATETLYSSASSTIAQTRTYYDDQSLEQATLGNPTKTEELIDTGGGGIYAATKRTYNSYGLITTEADPLNNTTTFTYDSLNLYPTTVTNAQSQSTNYTYDYTVGKPTMAVDPNFEVRKTVYDGIDRVREEWNPHPTASSTMLTRSITYTDAAGAFALQEEKVGSGYANANTHSIDLEDSSSQYLYATSSASLSITGSTTIELWVKPESTPTSGNDFEFVSKSLPPSAKSYDFLYRNDAGTYKLVFTTSSSGSNGSLMQVNLSQALSTSIWTHVAVAFTAETSIAEFFVNGTSMGTSTGSHTSIYASSERFLLGTRYTAASNPEAPFDGKIDDVRVWNIAKSQSAIEASLEGNLGGNISNLKAHWKLDNTRTDESGNNNTLTYIDNGSSGNNNPPFVTDVPYGGEAASIIEDTYTYVDGFGRVVQTRKRAEETDTYNVMDTWYDENGRVEIISPPYASSSTARTLGMTNPAMTTVYAYDGLDRVATTSDALGNTVNTYNRWDVKTTDANGHVKRLGRDAFGRLTTVVEQLATNTHATTSYEYDTSGNLTKITDAAGNLRNFTYDRRGKRLTAEDLHASGDSYFGSYTFVYNRAGDLATTTRPDSTTVGYFYDALHRTTEENWSAVGGAEVTYLYDNCVHGKTRKCQELRTDWSQSVHYDLAGNLKMEYATVTAQNYHTRYRYDFLGNPTQVVHADNSTTTYTYNAGGRIETVAWTDTGSTTSQYLASDINYSPHGAPTFINKNNDANEYFRFDAAQKYRLTEHAVGPTGSEGTPGSDNTHAIDLEKNSSQYLSLADSSPLSVTGDLTIEAWIKLESGPLAGSSYVIAGKWDGGFAGSATGRSYVFRYGRNAGDTYNFLDLILSSNGNDWTIGSKTQTLDVGTWYHIAVVYTASTGSAEFFYGTTGNHTSLSAATGLPTSIHDSSGKFTIGAREPASTSDDHFDGLIDDVRVWGSVRTEAELNSYKDTQLTSNEPRLNGYWKLNNSLVGLAVNTTLTNHNSGVSSTTVPFAGSSATVGAGALVKRLYTYDAVGNVLTTVATTTTGIATSTYAYDELDRLTRETLVSTTATTTLISKYGYTPIGNIASTTKHTTIATYSYEGNQGTSYANPHAVTKVRVGGGDKTFTYDNMGNMTYDPLAVLNNSWTFRNELDTITSLTMYTTLRYEAASRRVYLNREELPSNGPQGEGGEEPLTVRYPTPSYTDNATDAEKYIHIEGNGVSLGTIERTATTTRTFRTSADHLGSTRLVTNPSKEIVETADYEAFGSLATSTSEESFTEDRKFTSHEFDEGTEYTYAKARYLNTDIGRFISQDRAFIYAGDSGDFEAITGIPFEAYLADPQLQNSYSYARNNPVKLVDPNGEIPTAVVGAGIGTVIGLATQGISDMMRGQFSGWNAYGGAAVGGATQGFLWGSGAKLVDVLVGGTISGTVEGTVREGLDYLTGDVNGFEGGAVLKDALFSAGGNLGGEMLGKIFGPAVDITGITTGKNNYSAIFDQIMTKLGNGTIKNVSGGTLGKMGNAYAMRNMYSMFLQAILNGSQNFSGQQQYYVTPSGAIVTADGKLIAPPPGVQP